eukprot:PhM_4_TR2136/c0_g1_i7/m.54135
MIAVPKPLPPRPFIASPTSSSSSPYPVVVIMVAFIAITCVDVSHAQSCIDPDKPCLHPRVKEATGSVRQFYLSAGSSKYDDLSGLCPSGTSLIKINNWNAFFEMITASYDTGGSGNNALKIMFGYKCTPSQDNRLWPATCKGLGSTFTIDSPTFAQSDESPCEESIDNFETKSCLRILCTGGKCGLCPSNCNFEYKTMCSHDVMSGWQDGARVQYFDTNFKGLRSEAKTVCRSINAAVAYAPDAAARGTLYAMHNQNVWMGLCVPSTGYQACTYWDGGYPTEEITPNKCYGAKARNVYVPDCSTMLAVVCSREKDIEPSMLSCPTTMMFGQTVDVGVRLSRTPESAVLFVSMSLASTDFTADAPLKWSKGSDARQIMKVRGTVLGRHKLIMGRLTVGSSDETVAPTALLTALAGDPASSSCDITTNPAHIGISPPTLDLHIEESKTITFTAQIGPIADITLTLTAYTGITASDFVVGTVSLTPTQPSGSVTLKAINPVPPGAMLSVSASGTDADKYDIPQRVSVEFKKLAVTASIASSSLYKGTETKITVNVGTVSSVKPPSVKCSSSNSKVTFEPSEGLLTFTADSASMDIVVKAEIPGTDTISCIIAGGASSHYIAPTGSIALTVIEQKTLSIAPNPLVLQHGGGGRDVVVTLSASPSRTIKIKVVGASQDIVSAPTTEYTITSGALQLFGEGVLVPSFPFSGAAANPTRVTVGPFSAHQFSGSASFDFVVSGEGANEFVPSTALAVNIEPLHRLECKLPRSNSNIATLHVGCVYDMTCTIDATPTYATVSAEWHNPAISTSSSNLLQWTPSSTSKDIVVHVTTADTPTDNTEFTFLSIEFVTAPTLVLTINLIEKASLSPNPATDKTVFVGESVVVSLQPTIKTLSPIEIQVNGFTSGITSETQLTHTIAYGQGQKDRKAIDFIALKTGELTLTADVSGTHATEFTKPIFGKITIMRNGISKNVGDTVKVSQHQTLTVTLDCLRVPPASQNNLVINV